MTCSALVKGVSVFLEYVTVDKTFFGELGPADMATAAVAGMAGETMIFPGRINLVPFTHIGPILQNRHKG
jgi:hypothetical protein